MFGEDLQNIAAWLEDAASRDGVTAAEARHLARVLDEQARQLRAIEVWTPEGSAASQEAARRLRHELGALHRAEPIPDNVVPIEAAHARRGLR